MNDERPDGGFSIESLGEDSAELARHQLSLLEKSLGSSRDPAGASSLLDEAYRAAHSLKSAIDSARMPNVDRLARRIQDVVRATRSGALAVTPELGSMLASIARIARDALDAVSAGGVEPLSASSAASAMEEMLAHPGAWSVPPALSGVPVQWARVETVRLIAAGEAAGEARAASAAFARAAEESAGFTERLRSAFAAHGEAVQGLRDALPAGLVRAARGEPTTTIAAELADVVSALSVGTSGLEQALSRNAAAVREAAIHGARAAEKAEAAFGSFRSVRLDALLADLPRLVRRGARDSGRDVDLVQESTNLEVDAARAESVRAIVKGCVRALLGPSRARGRKSRRAEAIPASRLSVFARAAGEHLYLRIALSSGAPDPDRLKAVLEALQRRIEREGGSLEAESRKGGSASILATIRSAAALTTRTVEFLLARAGDAWYALPASAVVECIEAGMAMTEYVLDGSRLPTLRMNDTRDPREGVVVRTPRGGAVLLFDAIGGREYALQTIGGGESIAGISGSVRRPDGSAALLVDLGVLLPAPENVKGRLPASHAGSGARVKH